MTNKQIQIKLQNLKDFNIKDEGNGKTVKFSGSDFKGMQQDVEDIFFYSGGLNIYNTHYKEHLYDPDQHKAILTLEKIDDSEKNVGVKYVDGNYTSYNIEIDTLI
ncbi:MAG: hypothetical protein sL5_01220 [Candidatus Mesenet longicola]|uniref:Uncharacterized protein n=1 Tax=Candidatus Mesenet longicola TaxID=1892558 RepID=A0A8J3HU84_9RICK|nr:MAG: hypothetical protein sGL2_01140 [Candidatus Mesenet longicola]GHM59129.1 MAG: hypothetical protein sL5_01220 [Candidatus Mesenet longicola]